MDGQRERFGFRFVEDVKCIPQGVGGGAVTAACVGHEDLDCGFFGCVETGAGEVLSRGDMADMFVNGSPDGRRLEGRCGD